MPTPHPGDSYPPTDSHVIPTLLRKFHEGRMRGEATIAVWITGTSRCELLYREGRHLRLPDGTARLALHGPAGQRRDPDNEQNLSGHFEPPRISICTGADVAIGELAPLLARVVGFEGPIEYDLGEPEGTPSKRKDFGMLNAVGRRASTALEAELRAACA